MSAKTIKMHDAKIYAKKWQSENGFHAKAFLIPVDDLIACLKEMDVLAEQQDGHYQIQNVDGAGIRAYMAIKRPKNDVPTALSEKLLIVGTLKDKDGIHRDLVVDEAMSNDYDETLAAKIAMIDGSGVYDFTEPCPSNCDPNSPLFNP
ncbi:hypothetical protein [Lacinutrix salivirga]